MFSSPGLGGFREFGKIKVIQASKWLGKLDEIRGIPQEKSLFRDHSVGQTIFLGIKLDSMKSMVRVFNFRLIKVVHDVSFGIIFPDPCYQQDHILEGGLFFKKSLHLLTWSMWSFDATICSEALTADLVGRVWCFL